MARKTRVVTNQVIGRYSDGKFACVCCGVSEREFSGIDHIDGNGNKISRELGIPRGGYPLYLWLFKNGFPPEYAVLCMNCNLSKAKRGVFVHNHQPSCESEI